MTYEETLHYLYTSTPLFQNVGKDAYKEGLENTYELDKHFGHPHKQFKTIHIAGTNGKGSCSHTLAAILQSAGYKTGLYTSPHLVDFRERIRVNGTPIPKDYVTSFVEENRSFFEPLHPSFFELTTAMAFKYFAEQHVDVAVIEVGLGGRLDCTNIITPDMCIITNISFDHTQFLGNTLEKIAKEKAGIIKPGIPVVIGETSTETRTVFKNKAAETYTPITFAEDESLVEDWKTSTDGYRIYQTKDYADLKGELGGLYQIKNTNTILTAVRQLKQIGYTITEQDIRNGFANVCKLTGLMGRWQTIETSPKVICDTGHNVGGISYIVEQLKHETYKHLHIVIGMVNDKDISGVLSLLPKNAYYYFTQASVKRALPAEKMAQKAYAANLRGSYYDNVQTALETAKDRADKDDLIFIGGSSFIVADLLTFYSK